MSILHQNATLRRSNTPAMREVDWMNGSRHNKNANRQTYAQRFLPLLERKICSGPSLRSFEYSMLIYTEASKLKKWYSDVCIFVLFFSMSRDRYEVGFTLQSWESLWNAQAAVHGLPGGSCNLEITHPAGKSDLSFLQYGYLYSVFYYTADVDWSTNPFYIPVHFLCHCVNNHNVINNVYVPDFDRSIILKVYNTVLYRCFKLHRHNYFKKRRGLCITWMTHLNMLLQVKTE